MDVGVRELKQHLSDYLDRAARGEVITVTERGRPKAVLGPTAAAGREIDDGIAAGWITAPRRATGLQPVARATAVDHLDVETQLDADRGD